MMRLVYIPKRRLEDVSEAELLEQLGSLGSRRRGDYVRTLDTWQSVFPREQLFIGFFEDIHERPQELLSDIFDFLGVSHAVDWSASVRIVARVRSRSAGDATTDTRVSSLPPGLYTISWPS